MEKRFGVDQVCSLGTYTTLQIKAALSDLCRLEGVPIQEVKRITAKFGEEGEKTMDDFLKTVSGNEELRNFVMKHSDIINDVFVVLGSPKASSIHACGTVILPDEKTMYGWIPVRKQKDMVVSEWEGGEMESAGFLKEDVLGIAQLDKFRDTIDLIEEHSGKRIDLYKDIPLDDPTVYEAMGRGFLGNIFHFGARGLSSYTVQMKPQSIDELSACAALYRPSCIENNFHNEYLLRRSGEKEVEYPIGAEEVLKDTYGLMILQESVMLLCQKLGDFSLQEADDVRKAMGHKKIEILSKFEEKFVKGYQKSFNVSEEYAKSLWGQMVEFAKYGFNKCISGREKLHRNPNRKDKDGFTPTIAEMYKICNNVNYAKETGHKSLHFKYKYRGYGCVWFLDEDKRIRKAPIKNIYFSGNRQTYKITLENGKTISSTDNHAFPTDRGKTLLKDLKIGDSLYCSAGYEKSDSAFRYTIDTGVPGTKYEYSLNSEKGKMGFQTNPDSVYMKNKKHRFLKSNICMTCGKVHSRIEMHHIDGDHGNANEDNLIFLCPSCHKKAHYAMGRLAQGDKGLLSETSKIISIEKDMVEDVYDIEVDHPLHNFLTASGVITCNSHSVAYSINGYNSMWLKVHYPIEFWAVTFSRAKMEEFPFYLNEIKNSGSITVKPVNINKSQISIIADPSTNSMYWALNSVDQVGEKAQAQLIEERDMCGEYFSLDEFIDRQVGTGSAVNKSVVENLIYSGAFDEIENISSIQERGRLLQRFREIRKVKIDPTKDEYNLACVKGKENTDWWWNLQQKKKSGFAYFDYKTLMAQYLTPKVGKEWTFITGDQIRDWPEKKSGYKVSVGGYVIEMQERKSKKGPFCNLVLECNYEFIKVLVFPELFEDYQDFLRDCKESILLLNGNIVYNKFHNAFVLQTSQSTEFVKVGRI